MHFSRYVAKQACFATAEVHEKLLLQIANLIAPPESVPAGQLALDPLWKPDSSVMFVAAVSQHQGIPKLSSLRDLNPLLVVLNTTLPFAFTSDGSPTLDTKLVLQLADSASGGSTTDPMTQPWLPGDVSASNTTLPAAVSASKQQAADVANLQRRLRRGATVYLHCWALLLDRTGAPPSSLSSRGRVLTAFTPLLNRAPFDPPKQKYLLVQRDVTSWWGWTFQWAVPPPPPYWPEKGAQAPQWLGAADVRMILDETRYETDLRLVPELARMTLSKTALWKESAYVPSFSVNAIRPTQERRRWLLPENVSQSALPLHVTVGVAGPTKLNLLTLMEHAITQQHSQWGTTNRDTDDMVRLLVDSQAWLLGLTFVVAMLHLCMDILAFAQDVIYWRGMKSDTLARLSSRSVRVDFVFQAIVAAYLSQRDTSFLVMVPVFGGVLIGAWKVVKTCGVKLDSAGKSEEEMQAQQRQQRRVATYDSTATCYVAWALMPPLCGWAVFSLFYKEHEGWTDYALTTAVSVVYTSGFIMMVPQLYINYKLKSVAHMPWNVLFYRFSSTFIDDLFAFIIKMPTMHRISVFRDDLVFILYLAQRWYYPVDKSRTATVSGDGELNAAKKGAQAPDNGSDAAKGSQCVSLVGCTYVTLLTSDSFLPGVQALAYSLHKHSQVPLLVLATPQVRKHTRVQLRRLPLCSVEEVQPLPNPHASSVHVAGWVNSGYTKLHIWNLTRFSRVVYIDADAVVLSNVDDLFQRPHLSAAPDVFPPDKFNAGVLVVHPDAAEYRRLLSLCDCTPSHDGGDTGFLNAAFPDWYTWGAAHRLPFGDNAQRILHWFTASKAPGYWAAVQPLRIVHFSSSPKPWEQEGASKQGELEHMWWRLFMESKMPSM